MIVANAVLKIATMKDVMATNLYFLENLTF